MTTQITMDHPAFYQAVETAKPARKVGEEWSARATLGSIIGCSLAAWALVLSPFYFLG